MFTNLSPTAMFFVLLCGHFVADFALQTEWVATNKNRHLRDSFTPEQRKQFQIIWPHLLTAHSFHHGMMIYLITQNATATVLETVVHWIIDFGKCERWYGFHADQFLHYACKAIWVYLIYSSII